MFVLDNFRLSTNTTIKNSQRLLFILVSLILIVSITLYFQSPIYCSSPDGNIDSSMPMSTSVADSASTDSVNEGVKDKKTLSISEKDNSYVLTVDKDASSKGVSEISKAIKTVGSELIPYAATAAAAGSAAGTLGAAAIKASSSLPLMQRARVVGGAAIALKNVPSNIGKSSADKNEFFSSHDILSSVTTGNDAMDFLFLLQLLHKLQILFVFLIIYYSAFKFFNPYLVNYTNYLPSTIKNYALKFLQYFKAAGQIYVLIFCLLLLITTLLTDHYYDFFFIKY